MSPPSSSIPSALRMAAGRRGRIGRSGEMTAAFNRDGASPIWVMFCGLADARFLDRMVSAVSASTHNLPAPLTSFVGRLEELVELQGSLGAHRLVTLTGAGGCGKTRLALELADRLAEAFPHGRWWVDLAPIADPALVVSVVASTLSIREMPPEDLLDTLVDNLKSRRLLLILDNCEHLLTSCGDLATRLLRECPSVVILATSREPLAVEGEGSFLVPSLPVPSAASDPLDLVGESDAVRLFLDRARSVSDFTLSEENAPAVARICQRLDGIPLAIELAAARVRALSPTQIAEGLTDRFHLLTGGARSALPRQRTLEASVDWSYNLLDDPERGLFARLAVFAGAFDLTAVEVVCSDAEIEEQDVLDLLARLVDRSLVQADASGDQARYRLLETIRAYARQRLADSGEMPALREKHLDHYVSVAERAESELQGPTLVPALDHVEADVDNLRAAIDWAVSSGQADKALRIVGAAGIFWWTRAYYSEVQRMLETALTHGRDAPAALRAKALTVAANIAYVGDFRAANTFAVEAAELARDTGDKRVLSRALGWVGWTEFWLGSGPGVPALEEAVALGREMGDPVVLGRALYWLASTKGMARGDVEMARALIYESLDVARAAGDRIVPAHALVFLGYLEIEAGGFPAAESALKEALGILRAFQEGAFTSFALERLAALALLRGQYDHARRFADESLLTAHAVAASFFEGNARQTRARLLLATGEIEPAMAELKQSVEITRPVGIRFFTATSLATLAEASLEVGDKAAARDYVTEARSEAGDLPQPLADALLQSARVARAEGDVDKAETTLHEALRICIDSGLRPRAVDVLEELAQVVLERDALKAVRLLGTVDALRLDIGYERFPTQRGPYRTLIDVARSTLLDEAFDAALAEGAAMSLPDAADYVGRGRGERKRPAAGWESLTPTEIQVVRLVERGMSNPAIAAELFVTRNTIKAHLAHIFTKLSVSSRAELAAEASRRGL